MEWDYSGRKGMGGQKKKTGKVNEKKKEKTAKNEEVNEQGRKKEGKGVPQPHTRLQQGETTITPQDKTKSNTTKTSMHP